ncbi:hypothetical protein Psi02_25230 [Planotetraspora silvatica]|uniref:Uncharacterized protein n=1 Tax=Planotetraspora silvatica TaxID=234614 RepID=A0A8J3XM02_9ACTN|nr:hypothetical protein [Planotetraspora silvatica]GII46099.1 hypothetical protein Psi02_25230 [Planotetraspora silvatica]
MAEIIAVRPPRIDPPRRPSAGERLGSRLLWPRWLPAASAAVFSVAVLVAYGVSVRDIVVFCGYVALCLGLPGVLMVRALLGGTRSHAEEIALGLTLGYAVEVAAYIAARAVGAPLLVLAWPAGVVGAFLVLPRLRAHWRPGRRPRPPVWWSWSIALVVVYLVAWSARTVFRATPVTWPGLAGSFQDMSYHLALIGELKHHVPPTLPMVAGEPLFYHWFVYAHLAAASWITGIEPVVLLLRLAMLPMLAALIVLVGMLAQRMTGSRPAALLAVLGTLFVAPPSLYLGTNGAFTWGGVPDLLWTSPTQTFGSLLFVPVVLFLTDLLGRRGPARGRWPLLGVLLLALSGAKATYLPLLGAGLGLVVAVQVVRRRSPWAAVAALGMTAVCFGYAQLVLFGHTRQGMLVEPLYSIRTTWEEQTGLIGPAGPSAPVLYGIAAVLALCWGVAWSGAFGLLARPRLLVRPDLVLILGFGAAGLGTLFLLGHPTRSQLFFVWGAGPYMVIVAVHGLVVLLRRARLSRRTMVTAAGGGMLAAYLIPVICGVRVPLSPGRQDVALFLPYVVFVAVALVAAAALCLARGRVRAWAVMSVALAAVGLPADVHARVLAVGRDVPTAADPGVAVPQGTMTAARWLRANSDPDDLVATNAHCLWGQDEPCDSRHFWVSALSERRVLVEGWAYAPKNLDTWLPGEQPFERPFWDTARIQANDAVFTAPSAAAVRGLRDRYGVRWLFADERLLPPGSALGEFASLRFRSGEYAVYRIPG